MYRMVWWCEYNREEEEEEEKKKKKKKASRETEEKEEAAIAGKLSRSSLFLSFQTAGARLCVCVCIVVCMVRGVTETESVGWLFLYMFIYR